MGRTDKGGKEEMIELWVLGIGNIILYSIFPYPYNTVSITISNAIVIGIVNLLEEDIEYKEAKDGE